MRITSDTPPEPAIPAPSRAPVAQLLERKVSRRRFISAGTGGVGLFLLTRDVALASGKEVKLDNNELSGMLVDLTRCIGCRACENACRVRQGRKPLPTAPFGYGPGEGRLSFTNWTFVDFREPNGTARTKLPVKKQCMHCVDPACVSACPVAALQKTSRGSVVYNASRCIGCRYCMIACPFGIPRYEWEAGLTPRVGKCDFCDDRAAAGKPTACAAACPTGTLKFEPRRPESHAAQSSGEETGKSLYGREKVLFEAKARLAANPARYVSIYGDKVVGGTAWVYISDTAMDKFGFRTDLPNEALPSLTWKALAKIPIVVVVLGIVLSSVYRLRRRMTKHA